MFRKLRTRITVWVTALAVLLAVALGGVACYSLYGSAQQQLDAQVTLSSAAYGTALENYLADLEKQVVTLAMSGGITSQNLSWAQRQHNVEQVLTARPDLSGLYVIGRDGISINDSDYLLEDSSGEDYSAEEFFQSAMATPGVWIDDPVYDEWTDNITLTVTYAFNDGAGFDGIVGMDVHYDALLDIIQQGAIGSTGYTVLLAADGTFITHPDSQYVLDEVNYQNSPGEEPGFAAALRQILAPGDGRVENVAFGGEQVLLYYHTIEETGWKLVTIAKPHEFMGQFNAALRVILLADGLCLLLAVAVAYFIARSVARPITAMTQRMHQFSTGDLHSAMPVVRSKDELGVLHQSICASIETLNRYVSDISDVLQAIAGGDISGDVTLDYAGDFAPIKDSLRRILAELNTTMQQVNGSAVQVGIHSAQMSDAAQALSDNTVTQAGTIDDLTVSFGAIRAGLEQTAANTTTALGKTDGALAALDTTQASMDALVQSMEQIDAAAASIEKIIQTIDDIASQTNILALNAAVEAARAGQHGRGFAVVADEVGSLAGKSAESAKQTAGLIHSTLKAVRSGATNAHQASAQLDELQRLVNEVAGLVRDIESGANEQAGSANSVYSGIEQLSGMVQADAAMAEQTAGSSMELDQRAAALKKALAVFTLRDTGRLPG